MKRIKLLKSLIIVAPVLSLASPLIILSNTGCGKIHGYSADGSDWVGRISGTLEYTIDNYYHTYHITGNNSFTADSTFTIPHDVVIDNVRYHVDQINNNAFNLCAGLTGVDFGSVTSIGLGSFYGCAGLTKINLGSVTSIGDSAFGLCPLEEINVDSNNSAFRLVGETTEGFIQRKSDTATTITPVCGGRGGIACGYSIIPGAVTTISNWAFYACTGLTGVAFNMVTTIGENAFADCKGMTGMALNNVTSIGNYAFWNCPFQQISVSPDNTAYRLEGSYMNGFIRKKNDISSAITPVCGGRGGIACGIIGFPAGVTTIGDGAFYNCTGVTRVNFGSVTTIGDSAFLGCGRLAAINLGGATTIGLGAFRGCPFNEISVDAGNSAFELIGTSTDGFIRKKSDASNTLNPVCGSEGGIACGNIVIPAGVTTISGRTFYSCERLAGVDFGSVTTIGNYAFLGCTRLTGVDFGSVTTVNLGAFDGCTGITWVDLSSVINLGSDWSYACLNLASVTIGAQTYNSTDNGWDRVGPDTDCILYAPNETVADTFKSNVIKSPYSAKWTYQQIS